MQQLSGFLRGRKSAYRRGLTSMMLMAFGETRCDEGGGMRARSPTAQRLYFLRQRPTNSRTINCRLAYYFPSITPAQRCSAITAWLIPHLGCQVILDALIHALQEGSVCPLTAGMGRRSLTLRSSTVCPCECDRAFWKVLQHLWDEFTLSCAATGATRSPDRKSTRL